MQYFEHEIMRMEKKSLRLLIINCGFGNSFIVDVNKSAFAVPCHINLMNFSIFAKIKFLQTTLIFCKEFFFCNMAHEKSNFFLTIKKS